MQDFKQLAVTIPSDLETFTIKDKRGNTLILREPIALDFALMDELAKEGITSQQRIFQMALRLAVTFNGEPGVTLSNLAVLDRTGYKEMMNIILGFQLDIVPDRAESLVSQYLSNERE